MIAPGVKNPFLTHKADDTVLVPGGDVPELHAHVLTKCHAALGQARQALGPVEADRCWRHGLGMSLAAAVAMARG